MNKSPIFLCLFVLYTENFGKQNILFICLFLLLFKYSARNCSSCCFYQIWQASVFHETLPQLPDFWNLIDIFPLCSPTFLVLKENLFNKYNIPYFTEVNLITLFHLLFLVCRRKLKHPFTALLQARVF